MDKNSFILATFQRKSGFLDVGACDRSKCHQCYPSSSNHGDTYPLSFTVFSFHLPAISWCQRVILVVMGCIPKTKRKKSGLLSLVVQDRVLLRSLVAEKHIRKLNNKPWSNHQTLLQTASFFGALKHIKYQRRNTRIWLLPSRYTEKNTLFEHETNAKCKNKPSCFLSTASHKTRSTSVYFLWCKLFFFYIRVTWMWIWRGEFGGGHFFFLIHLSSSDPCVHTHTRANSSWSWNNHLATYEETPCKTTWRSYLSLARHESLS